MKKRSVMSAVLALALVAVMLFAIVSCTDQGNQDSSGTSAGTGNGTATTTAATTVVTQTQEKDPAENIPNDNGDGAIADDSVSYGDIWG